MQILILGAAQLEEEFRQKFAAGHDLVFLADHGQAASRLPQATLVFDLLLASQPQQLALYQQHPHLVVCCHTVTTTLLALLQHLGRPPAFTLAGFNAWPGMVNRPCLEMSAWQPADKGRLEELGRQLGTVCLTVDDRVGLVTPRVLSMVINEAYYACQEGTATEADVDLAMKLGTHYPFGPFEWADKIGIGQVYQVLEAVYEDTRDERYKICPALKKAYLRTRLR
ncbi:MAG: 3-hydroxyacyl-CoA dehydrogenase family protein [Adhaeribacter sp.]